jgi:5-formyltetrahydrofolate cyclo-ligase
MTTHDELRQRNRKLRAALSAEELELATAALAERILALPEFAAAGKIAAYAAVNGEIGLDPVIDRVPAESRSRIAAFLAVLQRPEDASQPFSSARTRCRR